MNPLPSGFGLRGRTALVTGASSGLGRHFALALAAAKATVIVAARRVDKLAAAVADIEAAGGRPDTPGEFVRPRFKRLYPGNKLIRNQPVPGGRTVDLRKVTMPVLNVSADGDVVMHTACSRGQGRHFGTSVPRAAPNCRYRWPHRDLRRRQGAGGAGGAGARLGRLAESP